MTDQYREKIKELDYLTSVYRILQGLILVVCTLHVFLSFYKETMYDRSIAITCFAVGMLFILRGVMNKYKKDVKYKLEEERWKEEVNKIEKPIEQ